jgi:hypothetical protein
LYSFTFIKSIGTVGHIVANPSLRNAGVFIVTTRELVAGLSVELKGLAVLFITVIQTVRVTITVPDVRYAQTWKVIKGKRRLS